MRILAITQYYFPECFLINEFLPDIVREGNEVTVITGMPNYPTGKIEKGYGIFQHRRENIDGVEVIRCLQYPRGSNKIQLMLNYLSFMVFASIKTLFMKKYDIVFSYQLTPITQSIPAILIHSIQKVPLVLYCLDLAPASGEQLINNGLFFQVYHAISRFVYHRCDRIAVSSKSFIEYLHNVNDVPIEKMTYLPQHSSRSLYTQNLSAADNGIVDFMFAGNIGKGTKIETAVAAAKILKNRGNANFLIHIVGEGSALEMLKNRVAETQTTDCFRFYGKISSNSIADYYRLADVLLITLRKGNITLPGKFQTYMATGKPIIAALEGSAKALLEEVSCGICVPPENPEAMADAMEDFIMHPGKYSQCGILAKNYFIQNFSEEIFVSKLCRLLYDCRHRDGEKGEKYGRLR